MIGGSFPAAGKINAAKQGKNLEAWLMKHEAEPLETVDVNNQRHHTGHTVRSWRCVYCGHSFISPPWTRERIEEDECFGWAKYRKEHPPVPNNKLDKLSEAPIG